MWIFAINGIAYVAYLMISGEWRVLWPKMSSFRDALLVTLYDMHVPWARRKGLPPQGKYNGAQRIALYSRGADGWGISGDWTSDLQADAGPLVHYAAGWL